ncbi:MAG: hypothetical protein ACLQU1_22065 [Bryobacteraceae bacterium]
MLRKPKRITEKGTNDKPLSLAVQAGRQFPVLANATILPFEGPMAACSPPILAG